MRNVFAITLFLSTISLIACGGESANSSDDTGCTDVSYCTAACDGVKSCIAGICYCEVEVPLTCTDVSDCTSTCSGTKSCSADGICECKKTEVLTCTDVSDCTSTCSGTKSCSADGICECEVTVEFVCQSDAECFTGCAGSPFCNAQGICQCDLGCVADANCEADCTGADSFSCSVGKCVCGFTEELGCVANVDCEVTCDTFMPASSANCDAGACYCIPLTATLTVNAEDESGNLVLGAFTVTSASDGSITWSSAGSATLVNIPLGDYDIVYGHVTSLVTPDPITVTLSTNGETVTESGVYLQSLLEVNPVTNPDILAVKGSQNVETLTLRLEATEDMLLNAFAVRFYADSGSVALGDIVHGSGTIPANTVVMSATLMRGIDVLSGPVGLQADLSYGADASGFDPGSADHYFATFPSLGYWVNGGVPSDLTIQVNLLNTNPDDVHLYAEVLTCSINAEDASANTVIAGGYTQSCPALSMQVVTVITNGVLEAFAENLPDGGIVIAGSSTGNVVSRYRFHASMEDFQITKLTLMNDTVGAFSAPVDTGAISQATIRYINLYGVEQTRSCALVGGTCTLAGLDMYVPMGGDAMLDIEVDATTSANYGPGLSGQTFRLGLQDQGNTITTFEAVGQTTSSTDNFTDGDEVVGQSLVNSFVVRLTKPTFAKASGLSTVLINGENRWVGTNVSADSAGTVDIEDLIYEFIGTGTLSTTGHKLYKGSTLLSAGFSFVGNQVTVTLTAPTGQITAGATETFYLDATVSGATASDTLSTRLIGVRWSDGEVTGIDEFGLDLDLVPAHTLTY